MDTVSTDLASKCARIVDFGGFADFKNREDRAQAGPRRENRFRNIISYIFVVIHPIVTTSWWRNVLHTRFCLNIKTLVKMVTYRVT